MIFANSSEKNSVPCLFLTPNHKDLASIYRETNP